MLKKHSEIINYLYDLVIHLRHIISETDNDMMSWIVADLTFIFKSSWKFIALIGTIVGVIVTLQFTSNAGRFDILSLLGGLSISGIIREMGPLMIGFMMVGKIGAYTTAELTAMTATDQILALEAIGVNTDKAIVIPRFYGIILSGLLLLLVGISTAFISSLLAGILYAGLTYESYLRSIPNFFNLMSVIMCITKCFTFSSIIAIISTYQTRPTIRTASGVGNAVVHSSIAIMISLVAADTLISLLFNIAGTITS